MKMFMKKGSYLFLASSMLASTIAATVNVPGGMVAQAEGTIGNEENSTIQFRTTLQDGMVTSSEKLTFFILANKKKDDGSIGDSLTNGQEITVNLKNQTTETSIDGTALTGKKMFSIDLQDGVNVVTVTIKNGTEELTEEYKITKEIIDSSEIIGDVVFSLEGFTLGLGYFIEPQRLKISNKERPRIEQFLALHEYVNSSFSEWESNIEGPFTFKKINIPKNLKEMISSNNFEINDSDFDLTNGLGTYDFSFFTGWQITLNNMIISTTDDIFLKENDIVRTQFSLAKGTELATITQGGNQVELFKEVSRDEATRVLAYINSSDEKEEILKDEAVKRTYDAVKTEIQQFGITQEAINQKVTELNEAVIEWATLNEERKKAYIPDLTDTQATVLLESLNEDIMKLPAIEQLTLKEYAVIQKLVQELQLYSNKQQKLVENYTQLRTAQEKMATVVTDSIATINQKINALPTPDNISLTDKTQLDDIAALYDLLPELEKKRVTNYASYTAALKKYQEVELKENRAKIEWVIELINTINITDMVNEVDLLNLRKARKAYDALPSEQQQAVTNYQKLVFAEEKVALINGEKEKIVQQVIDAIAKIPGVIASKDKPAIEAARAAYNNLTVAEQAKVTNYSKLTEAEQALASLEEVEVDKAVEAVEKMIQALPAFTKLTLQDKAAVEAARKAYEQLAASQKSQVKNYSTLQVLEAQLETLQQDQEPELTGSVKAVAQLIDNLPSLENVTLAHGVLINATYKAFTTLSAENQKKVPNAFTLTVVKAMYEELEAQQNQQKASALITQIAALPTVSLIDLTNEMNVLQAKLAYGQLTAEQKKLVTNYSVLTQLESQLATLKANALNVKQAISALPTASQITDNHRAAIEKARTMYAALSPSQKKLVTNYTLLEEAELTLVANQAELVKKLVQTINEWPAVITLANEKAIIAARKSYNALSFKEQKAVINYATLQSAEAQLEALLNVDKTVALSVEAMINDLPLTITLNDEAAIETAKKAYQALSASQKLFVSNINVLNKAEQSLLTLTDENRKEAKKVMSAIDLLPTKTNLKLSDAQALQNVRQQYNLLKTTQKKYVDNYAVLITLEKQLDLLEKREQALKAEDVEIDIPSIKNTTKLIEGYVTPGATVVIYHGAKKIKTAKVDSEGFYAVEIPRQKKNTKLKFIIFNEVGDKLVREYVTVKAAKVSAAKALKASATKISGKSSKSKTITIYKGSKKIRTTKSTTKGTFAVNIPKQKRATTLKVVVSDSAGNKSSAKYVKVK